jgi:V8-like Glu-specific endopeptidase
VLTSISRPRRLLTAAFLALLATAGAQASRAQTTVQTEYAIGLPHAKSKPYNFTGRVFQVNDAFEALATGTLIRRHTVLTAAHVVFDATYGFATSISFTRGLYENYLLSTQQGSSVAALSGYNTAVANYGEATLEADARDLGYVVINSPPVDNDWGVYLADPTQLTNDAQRFILGYPGVTFDGRTMAYIVPTAPYVQLGLGNTGAYNNDQYIAEPGFSGGPVYAVVNGQQVIVAELTTGNSDTTGEFNVETVRAVDTEAARFLQDAEYTTGLIKKVAIHGPTLATRGKPFIYNITIKFKKPNATGGAATTDRYGELKMLSDSAGTAAQPLVNIQKLSNTQFQVTFSTKLRSGGLVTLHTEYDKNQPAPKSTLTVRLQ